ncbi:MAG: Minf_1886 family protein, partial [Planctomycetota bacterium]
EGLKRLAVKKWGRLAMLVLNSWGVKNTRDLGEIVYLMIEHKWMSAQPTDSIDDFNDIYDFKTVFKKEFEF